MATRIKICGITNYEDAACVASIGAEYLGFNFFPGSRRYVTPERAGEIANKLSPKPNLVGVFVNATIIDIARIVQLSGIELIQLHGAETEQFATDVANQTGLGVIRAVRVRDNVLAADMAASNARFVLLDSPDKHEFGGIRRSFDWSKTAGITELKSKLFLAGGLNARNVAQAIKTVRPFAVDACSGLEMHDGIKDHQEMKEFVKSIRECDVKTSTDSESGEKVI